MRIRLLQNHIHYHPGLVLHTASSGAVGHLAELYLVLEENRQVLGIGEVRENIAYLNGLDLEQVRAAVVTLLDEIRWEAGPQEIIEDLRSQTEKHPAVARALVDSAMHDWWARQNNLSVSENLGHSFSPYHGTNQCIFWCSDDHCLEMAQGYFNRNFKELKLRVGIAEFDRDIKRISMLRQKLGSGVKLAVDANGVWNHQQALNYIDRLAELGIAYVEQPIAPGDWHKLGDLAEKSPIPIMLDESIASLDDVKRAVDTHENLAVHLKIVKIGGITPLLEAADIINRNQRILMIGQMNEGSGATAAAYQCAIIAKPKYAELYGADGLQDDVLGEIGYEDGKVIIKDRLGIGVRFNRMPDACLWEKSV